MAQPESAQFWLAVSRLLILLFTLFIGWSTYKSHALIKELDSDNNLLLSLPENVARVFMVGLCLFLAWLSGLPAADFGFGVDHLGRAISLGLVVGLATLLVVNLLTAGAIKQFGRRIYSPWLICNILPKRRREWALIALAFIPAIAMEELLFRSLWIGGFQAIVPAPLLIAGTSIIFGLMHQPQGRLGIVLAGAINVVFSGVFLWNGQLVTTLVAHYTVNLMQLVVAHFQRDWLESYQQDLSANLIDKNLGG
jgi:membrane protease YdiL (CAAX protease family)